MFRKLVAIEPVSLVEWGEKELHQYAGEVIQYDDIPSDDDEIIRRIGDADGVLLSYTSKINQ
ncbi:MAG: dihydrofolate reductase, partial [Hungatella hathewayi]|nr:dihydrofolate reductase [Hungatella hathewayi]